MEVPQERGPPMVKSIRKKSINGEVHYLLFILKMDAGTIFSDIKT